MLPNALYKRSEAMEGTGQIHGKVDNYGGNQTRLLRGPWCFQGSQ